MTGYTKIASGGGGEFALTKENFGKINDAVYDLKQLNFDPKDFGGIGNGTNDDTTAWQDCMTAAVAANGTFRVSEPPAYWRLTSPIIIQPASGAVAMVNIEGDPHYADIRWEGGTNAAVFRSYGWKRSTVRNLNVYCVGGTSSGTVAFDMEVDGARTSSGWVDFKNCHVFLDSANQVGWRLAHAGGATGGTEQSFMTWEQCEVAGSGAAGQVGWSNEHSNGLQHVWLNCGGSFLAKFASNYPTAGAAAAAGGGALYFYGCGGTDNDVCFEVLNGPVLIHSGRWEISQRFLVVRSGSTGCTIAVDSVDLASMNPADGIVFDIAYQNSGGGRPVSLDITNLFCYGTDHTVAFLSAEGVASRPSRIKITGSLRSADPFYTLYSTNPNSLEVDLLKMNSAHQVTGKFGKQMNTLTYSASITPEATRGDRMTLVVTNGTAFTINNPLNPQTGQEITLDIKNSAGGAMGVITWGAAFLLAGAFTNPANTKRRTIRFYYDGTNWIELNRAAADI